jgi:hypothetical protein
MTEAAGLPATLERLQEYMVEKELRFDRTSQAMTS